MTAHMKAKDEIQPDRHVRVVPLSDKQVDKIHEEIKHVLTDWGHTFKYITCHNCDLVKTCAYSFDPYNTDGDCLGMK